MPQQDASRLIDEGNACEDAGRLQDALRCYDAAIALMPGMARAHLNRGNALQALGDLDGAFGAYAAALSHQPDYAAAHFNLGNTHRHAGRRDAALAAYQRALALKPDFADAYVALGALQEDLGQPDAAVASYRHALQINPAYAEAHCNLGNALAGLGQAADAAASYRSALERRPDYAEAHCNLGQVLVALGQPNDAIASYARALRANPAMVEAHCGLGNVQYGFANLKDAIASYRLAAEIRPDHLPALNGIGNCLNLLGDLDGAIDIYRRALEIDPDFAIARSNLLLIHNYISRQRPEDLLAEARVFGERVARTARPPTTWGSIAEPSRRLRVGFVSGDLRNHPVGYFTESTFDALRRAFADRLELHVYANQTAADAVTRRIKAHCHGWRTVLALSDAALARQVGEDRIDILIDLSGHTAENRLPMFAWKPAPIQATWLGYFATTGVAAIDYFIADPWTLPVGEEVNFTERIWRLPETRLCFTPPAEAVAVVPRTESSGRYMTFGCFNNLTKVNAAVVTVWARILDAVPRSTLFLKSMQFQDPQERARIVEQFAREGIAAQRLRLEAHSSRADYLAAYNDVDIALDPFPFPGGTTTAEALWMGVPVLTLTGQSLLSRQGVGLLANVGLSDWIAVDADDYVARAAAHAADLPRLAALHARLRQQVLASPLCDAPRFAVHFEAALRGMWETWCEQQSAPR